MSILSGSFRHKIVVHFVVIFVSLASSARAESVPFAHVRVFDRHTNALVERGATASPTFRALIERLNASDVIVYVKANSQLARALDGQLSFVGRAEGIRYVLVELGARDRSERQQIAILGHELQHAVEVAQTPPIVDSQSLGVAYERLGFRSFTHTMSHSFDTRAAIEAGRQIRRELAADVTPAQIEAPNTEMAGRPLMTDREGRRSTTPVSAGGPPVAAAAALDPTPRRAP